MFNFNFNPNYYLYYFIFISMLIWAIVKILQQWMPKKYHFTNDQKAVLYHMLDQGMVAVIRIEKNLFQIIYADGKAVQIWHPEFIEFFSFLEINEVFYIYKALK